MIIEIIGLSPKLYFTNKYNIFDALLILIGTLEILVDNVVTNKVNYGLYFLHGFRIMRLLKIVKRWKMLQNLVSTIFNTLKDLRNFAILLFIIIFTFTILALEIFAYRMKFDENDRPDLENGESPRMNFDGFINAITSVFIVI